MNSNSAEKGNVFRNRNFRLVFLGALVSELGALLYSFAVGFYILEISGNNDTGPSGNRRRHRTFPEALSKVQI